MSPDKIGSHQRVETSRPGLMETIALVCRNKVGGNIRGLSAAAFLAAASVMGCQPAPGEDCKDKACDVSNPDDSGTPTDITDTTDDTDPTCPGDPDCPPVEVPDTTPPAKPIMALTGIQEVGPSTPSVLNTGTVDGSDTEKVEYSVNNGTTWTLVPTYTAGSDTFADATLESQTRIWRAIDKAGNISEESDPFAVVEDALAPSTPIIANPDVMIFGPNDPTMTTLTGTLPQASETFDAEYRITNNAGTGNWTDIPTYSPGDTTFYTSVPMTDSTIEVRALDEWANASATDSTRLEGDFLPPIGGEIPTAPFKLAATETTFSIPGTYSTDTKIVKVLGPDNSERGSHIINDGNYTFSLPATTTANETGVFSVQVIDAKGNARILGTVNVERVPPPTISNLAIDCSSTVLCATTTTYPISFNVAPGVPWTATIEKISGNGGAGTLDAYSGIATTNTVILNNTTGDGGGAVIRVTINTSNEIGADSKFIEYTIY